MVAHHVQVERVAAEVLLAEALDLHTFDLDLPEAFADLDLAAPRVVLLRVAAGLVPGRDLGGELHVAAHEADFGALVDTEVPVRAGARVRRSRPARVLAAEVVVDERRGGVEHDLGHRAARALLGGHIPDVRDLHEFGFERAEARGGDHDPVTDLPVRGNIHRKVDREMSVLFDGRTDLRGGGLVLHGARRLRQVAPARRAGVVPTDGGAAPVGHRHALATEKAQRAARLHADALGHRRARVVGDGDVGALAVGAIAHEADDELALADRGRRPERGARLHRPTGLDDDRLRLELDGGIVEDERTLVDDPHVLEGVLAGAGHHARPRAYFEVLAGRAADRQHVAAVEGTRRRVVALGERAAMAAEEPGDGDDEGEGGAK